MVRDWLRNVMVAIGAVAVVHAAELRGVDYIDPPTESDLQQTPYRGHGFIGSKLFWQLSELGDPQEQAKSRERCQALLDQGIQPVFQMFAWRNTFQRTVDGDYDDDPAMRQWADWMLARADQYWARDSEGAVWQIGNKFLSGYITLPQPMHSGDLLPGMSAGDDWGDWMAHTFVDLCVATGFRGIAMADGYSLLRRRGVTMIDFHPEVVDAFLDHTGLSVTGSDAERAQIIIDEHRLAWTDWWCERFALWFADMDRLLHERTGDHMLYRFQNDMPVAQIRQFATDHRVLLEHLPPERFLFTIEPNAFGPHDARTFGNTMALVGDNAGRTPAFQCGVRPIMAQSDTFEGMNDTGNSGWPLWEVVGNTMPDADADERLEWIWKYMKYHLLAAFWCHVATEEGATRRAVGYYLRYRNDKGVLPAAVDRLKTAHVPSAPWGPAVYYSEAIERSFEAAGDQVPFDPVETAIDNGLALAYFVSDQALPQLDPAHHPTAWYLRAPERLPADERASLEAIAPIRALGEDASNPIAFSDNGMGFGFIDQHGQHILLVARRDWRDQQAVTESVQVHVRDLPDGDYQLRDLLNDPYDEQIPLTVADGSATVAVELQRWDSRVFVLEPVDQAQRSVRIDVAPVPAALLQPTIDPADTASAEAPGGGHAFDGLRPHIDYRIRLPLGISG